MRRLSAETAMPETIGNARKLVREIEQTSTALASGPGQALAHDLNELIAAMPGPLRVDVARPEAMSDEELAAVAATLGPQVAPADLALPDRWSDTAPAGTLRVFALDQPPIVPVGETVPVYLAIMLPANWLDIVDADELDELVRGRVRVLLLPLEGVPDAEVQALGKRLAGGGRRMVWAGRPGRAGELGVQPWLEEIRAPEWKPVDVFAQALALANACDQVNTAFTLVLAREGESLTVRRAQLDQRMQQTRRKAPPVRAQDLAREIEAEARKEFAEFAHGIKADLARWTAPRTGELSTEMNRTIAELDELHVEEKVSANELTVPQEFERHLIDLLRARLQERARRDLRAVADLQELVKDQTAEHLREAGLPDVPLDFDLPQIKHFEDHYLANQIRIKRPYRRKTRSRGLYDYVMAARKYQMLFIMLLPMFGGAKVFEGTVLEKILPFLGGAVLLVGIIKVAQQVPVERAETMAEELNRAREELRGEVESMITGAERAWEQILSEHLKEQPAALRMQVEIKLDAHLREVQRTHKEAEDFLQEQLHALDDTASRHKAAGKTCENMQRDIDRLRQDLGTPFEKARDAFGDVRKEQVKAARKAEAGARAAAPATSA